MVEQPVDAACDGAEVRAEQSWAKSFNQLVEESKGLDFRWGEPQPGEFKATILLVIVVATVLVIVGNGGVEVIPQITDTAVSGGAGAFQVVLNVGSGNRPTTGTEEFVQFKDTSEAIQQNSRFFRQSKHTAEHARNDMSARCPGHPV